MKIPSTLNILGVNYQIKIVGNINEEDIIEEEDKKINVKGYISTNHAVILLSNDTNAQNKLSVFIHEIIEAIDLHLALNLTHDNIDRLETALY